MALTPDVFSVPSASDAGDSWQDIKEELDDASRDGIESLTRTMSNDCGSVHSLPSHYSSYGIVNSTDGRSVASGSEDFEHMQLTTGSVGAATPRGFFMVRYPCPIFLNSLLPSQARAGLRLKIRSKRYQVLKDGFCKMRPPRAPYAFGVRRVADDNPWVALLAQMSVGRLPPPETASYKSRTAYQKAIKQAVKQLRGEYTFTLTELRPKELTMGPQKAKKEGDDDDTRSEISVWPNLLTNEQAAAMVMPSILSTRNAEEAENAAPATAEKNTKSPAKPAVVRSVSAVSVGPAGVNRGVSWAALTIQHRPNVGAMKKRHALHTRRDLNCGYGDKVKVVTAEDFQYMKATMEGKFAHNNRAMKSWHYEGDEDVEYSQEDGQPENVERVDSEEAPQGHESVEDSHPLPRNVIAAALDLPATYAITRR